MPIADSIQPQPPASLIIPHRRAWKSILRDRRFRFTGDALLRWLARGSAAIVLIMLVSLVWVLAKAATPSIRTFGLSFITGTNWRPNELEQPKRSADGKVVMEDGEIVTETIPPSFGALPVIYGTAASSVVALMFAVPLGLGTALFLVRVAPRLKIAGPVSFLVEFLAAIPSIAYGIWGIFVLTPFLQRLEPAIRDGAAVHLGLVSFRVPGLGGIPGLGWLFSGTVRIGGQTISRTLPLSGRDLLAGGLILGIMILPIITAVGRDVLKAVPRAQIEGTLALGATWWQSCREMLRYSRSGLFGAVMLGLARAAGETMAVTMVIGNNNQIVPSIFAPAQTMSSLLANEFAEAGSEIHRAALIEVALILLLMSLLFNVVARWFVVGGSARTAAAH